MNLILIRILPVVGLFKSNLCITSFTLCTEWNESLNWLLISSLIAFAWNAEVTLCNYLCSSFSFFYFSASIIQNIGEVGAKNYFTDHRTANAIRGFMDSVPVLKIHDFYEDTQRFEQLSIPTHTQARQGENSVLM